MWVYLRRVKSASEDGRTSCRYRVGSYRDKVMTGVETLSSALESRGGGLTAGRTIESMHCRVPPAQCSDLAEPVQHHHELGSIALSPLPAAINMLRAPDLCGSDVLPVPRTPSGWTASQTQRQKLCKKAIGSRVFKGLCRRLVVDSNQWRERRDVFINSLIARQAAQCQGGLAT